MSIPSIDELMHACIQNNASDIHLSVGAKPTFRRNTEFAVVLTDQVLVAQDVEVMMKAITPERIQNEYKETGSGDFSVTYQDTRFRGSVFRQKGNCSLVLRRIPKKILNPLEIGLPPAVIEICDRARGLFLVTGPTGSGKTTTLASLVNYINENFSRHILTFEDPIEYYHEHKQSIVNQREIGVDVTTFPEALRRGLRQDPDVILVGEMRDLETIRAAVTAAETGHLVFATLHTSGASSTINRIVDAFPADEQEHIKVQIASSLVAVLSQTLCPRIDTDGMVAAYEFLFVTPGIKAIIRGDRPFQLDSEIQTGKKYGMQLLDDHLFTLVKSGAISAETANAKSREPKLMTERLERLAREQQ